VCVNCAGPHYNRCQWLQILGIDADGSLADLVSVPEERLLELPASVPDRTAALVEPLAVAVHAVRSLGVLVEDLPVLVFGGGPIGWLAAVILGARGHQVHVAETNPFRRDMVRAAGHTVTDAASPASGATAYQAGLEASGTGVGLRTLVEAVAAGGVVSAVGLPKGPGELDVMSVISKELTVRGSRVYTREDFVQALGLLEDNRSAYEPLITHDIALSEVVDGGLARIEAGGPVGKIVVRGDA
jgi:2-desacetyl-2-hydroxyethyl bacteriochlorophyllide A dehydrogenase